jgi:hypothetical protein
MLSISPIQDAYSTTGYFRNYITPNNVTAWYIVDVFMEVLYMKKYI